MFAKISFTWECDKKLGKLPCRAELFFFTLSQGEKATADASRPLETD